MSGYLEPWRREDGAWMVPQPAEVPKGEKIRGAVLWVPLTPDVPDYDDWMFYIESRNGWAGQVAQQLG